MLFSVILVTQQKAATATTAKPSVTSVTGDDRRAVPHKSHKLTHAFRA